MELSEFELKLRLEAIKDGEKRSRLAFLVATIISLSLIIVGWNAYLSWYRHNFALKPDLEGNALEQFLQKELLAQWVKGRAINISLLGIQVMISDAHFLGAIGLLVTSIWFFLSVRRDNHSIGLLLRETQNAGEDTKRLIFREIISSLIFIRVTSTSLPIRALDAQPNPTDQLESRFLTVILKIASPVLYLLPPLTILFLLVLDFLSLFITSPFRIPRQPVLQAWDSIAVLSFWIENGVGVVLLGVTTAIFSWNTLVFERATRDVLREYEKFLTPPA
jgi:hypothetical protein